MKIIQIVTDFFDTSVYENLFRVLRRKVKLEVIVKEDLRQKTLNYNYKLFPFINTSPRLFGIHINGYKAYKKILNSNIIADCALIHSHFLLIDGFIAFLLKLKLNIKYVVSIRATCLMALKRKVALHNYLTACLILRNAESIFFQSNHVLNIVLQDIPFFLRSNLLKKSIIICNGIDEYWLNNINTKTSLRNLKDIRIITVASIEVNKNQLFVAKTIDSLNKKGFNFSYSLVGNILDTDYYNRITKFSCVNYLGTMHKSELIQAYRSSDIFIMLSHNETFGLVYAEAISQGLPIIYTKGQGFDGQFENGYMGLCVSSNSQSELENAILKIVERYECFTKNSTDAVNKFNWESIGNEYNSVYRKIIDNNLN